MMKMQSRKIWYYRITLIILLCLANDVSFALLSGPPDRYHHRILALLATTAMIALADRPVRKKTA